MSLEKLYNLLVKAFVLSLFGMGLILGCANPVAPTGGPKDSLPPKVLQYAPEYGKTNFSQFDQKRVVIEFDEYMVLKNQQSEFYVSPFTSIKPTVSMRGRSLYIQFLDTLKENQTYALNFGNSITDNNEGNILYGFRYVFSTGDSIDSMLMSGYTVDAYSRDSIGKTFILFYDAALDTIPDYDSLLLKVQPSAVARSQTYGGFIAENLKPIDYKIYAFEDTNYNQTYDPGVDKVGFLDTVYNPETSPSFNIWYDTTRKYLVSDPQLYFMLFKEETFTRQYLKESLRPNQHQVVFDFATSFPVIDSIGFDSLDMKDIIIDYLSPERDSLSLWLNVDSELLPDTLKGTIISHRHDSLNVLRPDTQRFNLAWKFYDLRSRKEVKEEQKDTTKVENPFKLVVDIKGDINPNLHIPIRFEYPLIELDTAAISLIREGEDGKRYKVNYDFVQDSINMRQWTLKANWRLEQKYSLTLPEGTFKNVARQSNDSLFASFSVLSPEKYATLIMNVKGETPDKNYIIQLLGDKDRVIEQRVGVKEGTHRFEYISPANLRIRVLRDDNGNGKWDTGVLVKGQPSERAEMFFNAEGDLSLEAKANWEMEFDVDMNEVFYEMTLENVNKYLAKLENAKKRAAAKEDEKSNPKYHNRDEDSSQEHDHKHEHEHDHE